MLPVKKIYIDTKKKTTDSISNSNLKYEIPETIALPHNTIFYIDDICIPHSWYTIEDGLNDRIYIQLMNANQNVANTPGDGSNECRTVIIDPGNYNLQQLRAELKTKINAAFASLGQTEYFEVTDDAMTNTLMFTTKFTTSIGRVLTDTDIQTGLVAFQSVNGVFNASWNGPSIDTSNPMDMNDIFKNTDGTGYVFSALIGWKTQSVDLQPIKNIYITSPNLGTYKTFSPSGGRTVIKKVPVNAGDNQMIFSNITSSNDYLDCSRQTLKTLQFELQTVNGLNIPLHGSHVSFSLVFDKYRTTED